MVFLEVVSPEERVSMSACEDDLGIFSEEDLARDAE